MWFSKLILRILGWKVTVTVPDYPKCIICVAPHTSNLDFIFGKLAYMSVGRQAGFLMKESWFKWPLGYFFRSIGGVPVARKTRNFHLLTSLWKNSRTQTNWLLPSLLKEQEAERQNGIPGFLKSQGKPEYQSASEHLTSRPKIFT